ncbi:MAG: efflux RND transporter periplasmic adaptor subunit [Chthoniobacterales bacterium]|nr:efflux RND transporter periplasmic adaptor subunit [Chthoniobacterales bacterium]
MHRTTYLPFLLFSTLLATLTPTGCSRPKPPTPNLPEVRIIHPSVQSVPIYREFVGQIEGAQNANILPRVAGYLITREFEEGSFVQAGQVLYRIDPRPYEAALAATQAQLAQAQAKAELARITLERQTELFKTRVISAQEFDVANQNSQAANADVLAAQAALQNAQLNLEFCTIRAPFEGIVGQSIAQIGDLVSPNDQSPLTVLSQINPVKVSFSISEQEYLMAQDRIHAAQSLPLENRPRDFQILLANGETYPHQGVFAFLDRQIEPLTGTIRVISYFPNPNAILRPGQFAKVKVLFKTIQNAILIPQRAVQEIQGLLYQVAIVNSENKVEFRAVRPGPRFQTNWVITEGISPSDSIIVEGFSKLRNGMTVRPIPDNPSPAQPDQQLAVQPSTPPPPLPTTQQPSEQSPSPQTTPQTNLQNSSTQP